MLIKKAIEKYEIPRAKLVILTKCFAPLNDDPYSGRLPPDAESTKEYVNKHGLSTRDVI
jgi:aryl-alcohol dehydrogenase-like predicted oxidoreductase